MDEQQAKVSVYSFSTLADAQRAYAELIERGLARSDLEVRGFDDEAGPSSGNFILEYKDTDVHFDSSWMDMIANRDDPNVGAGRQQVRWSCEAILIVQAGDPARLPLLEEMRRSYGGQPGEQGVLGATGNG